MTRTSEWPPFDGDPGRYVVPEAVAMHAAVPAGSAESAVVRLRAVWDALRRIRIGYAHEPPGPGPQRVRPPAEVLVAPRAGTCLDLALVLAGALEHAGLRAGVVLLDPAGDGDGHALTVARLHGDRPFPAPAAEFAAALDGPPRDFVAIDPNGLAVSLGATSTTGLDTDLDTAVATGHAMLSDPRFTWRPPVPGEPGRHRPPRLPPVLPLREIYRAPDAAGSVLALVRAEYALTPFQARDELLVLDDFARRVAAGERTGLVVVHGTGGAGKTRLALELADRFRREGWYAGPLRSPDGLAEVTAPLMVIVDYADASVTALDELLDVRGSAKGRPPWWWRRPGPSTATG
ncbi:ATP-binding protein [Actinoplanes sp. NPDC049802]|uniref:ATP-binding protein n=1 Tax=Actinoplanes sp. NPDC049802 TaxID=3154742 RepID=UPI0033C0EC4E